MYNMKITVRNINASLSITGKKQKQKIIKYVEDVNSTVNIFDLIAMYVKLYIPMTDSYSSVYEIFIKINIYFNIKSR
jgi:hypothetical protein